MKKNNYGVEYEVSRLYVRSLARSPAVHLAVIQPVCLTGNDTSLVLQRVVV